MTEREGDGVGDEQVVVRPAQVEDREAAFALSATIWDGNDYIPYVWDTWIAAGPDEGVLLVAVTETRLVGLMHLRYISEDEGWIEGVRVDPSERRKGIARMLVSRSLAAADEHGVSVVRLMTDESNVASQQLFGRFNFTRMAEVVLYEAPAAEADVSEAGGPQATQLGSEDFDRVWAWLEVSNLRPFTGGLEFQFWAGRALSEPSLRAYLANGDVWALEEWETLQALAIVAVDAAEGDEEASLQARYIDGTADALSRLALMLRRMSAERGCAKVEVWLPNLLILRDAMQGAGYEAGEEAMWIYAREMGEKKN